jgi:hypothetical protein
MLNRPQTPEGLNRKLFRHWTGPWEVIKVLPLLNIRIRKLGNADEGMVVHITWVHLTPFNAASDSEITDASIFSDGSESNPGPKIATPNQIPTIIPDSEDTERAHPGIRGPLHFDPLS